MDKEARKNFKAVVQFLENSTGVEGATDRQRLELIRLLGKMSEVGLSALELTKVSKYIRLFGVELEVAVPERHNQVYAVESNDLYNETDGSIHQYISGYRGREFKFQSGKDQKNTMDILGRFYELHEPRVNASMGMHIHISFANNTDRDKLCTKPFVKYFYKKLRDNTELMGYRNMSSRVESTTGYAKNPLKYYNINGSGFEEYLRGVGERGCGINYRNIRGGRNTIEFRVFPAVNSADKAQKMVSFLAETVDEFIDNYHNIVNDEEFQ